MIFHPWHLIAWVSDTENHSTAVLLLLPTLVVVVIISVYHDVLVLLGG
jgi:hypothetical protein